MAGTRKYNLGAVARIADEEQIAAAIAVPEERRFRARRARPSSREGKKGVLIYVSPGLSRELRQLALDEDSTVQALGHEALDSLLVQRGRSA